MGMPTEAREIRGRGVLAGGYPHKELTEKIIGCAIAVHRELHAGYVEGIYENALVHELKKAGLAVARQVQLPVYYDGVLVGEHRADLIVGEGGDSVVVELKAVSELTEQHVAQLLSTMKAASMDVGLLLNFHAARLVDGLRRVIWQKRPTQDP